MNLHAADFEKSYIALREKERRVYSDRELLQLPDISEEHPHYSEWQIRKESTSKLMRYLARHDNLKKILEAGCGNGWLSAQLATLKNKQVTGMDINLTELAQAERVLANKNNLRFMHGDVHTLAQSEERYDCIIFAACMQYFESPKQVISASLEKLNTGGELHIIDSHFYTLSTQAAAQKRSAAYFSKMGFPELTKFYFHHLLNDVRSFDLDRLYTPSLFRRYISMNKSPFPWLRIKKTKQT
jgi:2-polyprenyl-3-methyl-5-hydroxy-6-metoxy-1,4-benzoquinol methylase